MASNASSMSVMSQGAVLIKLGFLVVCASLSTLLLVFHQIFQGSWSTVTPLRWLSVTFTPLLIVYYALLRSSLSKSGAALALVIGAVLTLANLNFLFALLFFFISSSKATRFRESAKAAIEGSHFRKGGERNWIQVLCNGGVALELALLYLLDVGSEDLPIDFTRHYRDDFHKATWLSLALLGSLATCGGDTWASEIGTAWNMNAFPRLITNLRRVPKGTNGGVTLVGLIMSFLGGATVGLGFYAGVALFSDQDEYLYAPVGQWKIIILGGVCGFVGSLLDSVLGATCQYSGIKEGSAEIFEAPGPGIRRISGLPLLDNHGVNLLSSLIMALITPNIALKLFF